VLCGLPFLLSGSAAAQTVPSPEDVLGYPLGERFTDAASVVRYAEALAAGSERVELVRYGTTPEGRPLVLLVVATESNLRRMDELLADNARLLSPEVGPEDARSIARANPSVVWFTYGQHGDESASTEAALWTAYELAAGSPDVDGILDSVVVVLDPAANPDGRDRYVQWYRGVRGLLPNPSPGASEHHPPWPAGRYNHYLFDLNRDWTWATQAETRGRLLQWGRWNPQVHVDFHEMGYRGTYFFFPAAEPVNPIYPDYTLRWAEYFGRANAAEFDRRRWLYYSGEQFDLFYPGYGDSWPSLVGAIGMTYEQAGSGGAGLEVERRDGTLLTLRERATHHRVAGISTLRATMHRKTDLLMEYAAFHRGQGDGLSDVLLVPGEDRAATDALVDLLHNQGVRVERATRAFRATSRPHLGFPPRDEFPIGTLRIQSRQARGRLALTLLQPETLVDEAVSATYDITAWSLPYAYGVEAHSAAQGVDGGFRSVPGMVPAVTEEAGIEDAYGYLVPPGFESAGPIYRYVAAGGRAYALPEPFEAAGGRWLAGTYFLPGDQGAVDRLTAAGLGSLASPVTSGRTSSGRDLGTQRSLTVTPPRIGVLTGDGLSPTSFGAVWFLLEQLAGIPFDALPSRLLERRGLAEYEVLVIPSGSPGSSLDEDGRIALEDWLRTGGTLVALSQSARWVAETLAGIERRSDEEETSADEGRRLGLRTVDERRSDAWEDAVHGIILPVRVDADHPLGWGSGTGNDSRRAFVLHLEDLAFEPSDRFATVVAFEEGVQAVSGVASESVLQELSASSWLVTGRVGSGRVILFADDPLFRLMWRSNFPLFTNALLLGPALR
jgi:hypothetical protein